MGKDLGEMIGEINDASSALSKHKNADDPVIILLFHYCILANFRIL